MGEQIFDAIKNGAKLIYLTLGGSATNDAGCGMAVGVGYKFFNEKGNGFIPTGGTLQEIKKITFPQNIRNVKFIALCDVKNVLYGKTGAAFVYAKQKGATDDDIVLLDKNLQALTLFANLTDMILHLLKEQELLAVLEQGQCSF